MRNRRHDEVAVAEALVDEALGLLEGTLTLLRSGMHWRYWRVLSVTEARLTWLVTGRRWTFTLGVVRPTRETHTRRDWAISC